VGRIKEAEKRKSTNSQQQLIHWIPNGKHEDRRPKLTLIRRINKVTQRKNLKERACIH
jgi:hypothetical protein